MSLAIPCNSNDAQLTLYNALNPTHVVQYPPTCNLLMNSPYKIWLFPTPEGPNEDLVVFEGKHYLMKETDPRLTQLDTEFVILKGNTLALVNRVNKVFRLCDLNKKTNITDVITGATCFLQRSHLPSRLPRYFLFQTGTNLFVYDVEGNMQHPSFFYTPPSNIVDFGEFEDYFVFEIKADHALTIFRIVVGQETPFHFIETIEQGAFPCSIYENSIAYCGTEQPALNVKLIHSESKITLEMLGKITNLYLSQRYLICSCQDTIMIYHKEITDPEIKLSPLKTISHSMLDPNWIFINPYDALVVVSEEWLSVYNLKSLQHTEEDVVEQNIDFLLIEEKFNRDATKIVWETSGNIFVIYNSPMLSIYDLNHGSLLSRFSKLGVYHLSLEDSTLTMGIREVAYFNSRFGSTPHTILHYIEYYDLSSLTDGLLPLNERLDLESAL